mmetsp:Transcript_49386/g.141559  ORF Transcript_49386/g.141559 Transcript_49386/m.141559 type:complete len:217 (+) Transcript_49386:945-1595(+)
MPPGLLAGIECKTVRHRRQHQHPPIRLRILSEQGGRARLRRRGTRVCLRLHRRLGAASRALRARRARRRRGRDVDEVGAGFHRIANRPLLAAQAHALGAGAEHDQQAAEHPPGHSQGAFFQCPSVCEARLSRTVLKRVGVSLHLRAGSAAGLPSLLRYRRLGIQDLVASIGALARARLGRVGGHRHGGGTSPRVPHLRAQPHRRRGDGRRAARALD